MQLSCPKLGVQIIVLIFVFLSPKKYITSAELLINSNNSTNLSDINPFMLGNKEELLNNFYDNSLINEIKILQSNLVLDSIIIEKNLRYIKGPKKNQYLTVDDLASDFEIKNPRGSNVISISYKSSDPVFGYSMLNSVIENYKQVLENMNVNKAQSDKQFLTKEYLATKTLVDKKISEIKSINTNIETEDVSKLSIFELMLGKYDKRMGSQITNNTKANIENKKLHLELEEDKARLKMIKSKLDWSNLVENISRNATKVIIIKRPVLKHYKDFSEPKIFPAVIFSLILSAGISAFAVLLTEICSKKQTFLTLNSAANLISKNSQDFSDLFIEIKKNELSTIGIISLVESENEKDILENFKNILGNKNFVYNLTNNVNTIYEHIENINSSDYIVILSKINYSDKKIYKNIRKTIQKLNKRTVEYVIYNKIPMF